MEDLPQDQNNLAIFLRRDIEALIFSEEFQGASVDKKKKHIVENFEAARNTNHFKNVSTERFQKFLNDLDALNVSDDAELVNGTLNVALSFLKEIFPTSVDLETILRNTLVEGHGWIELNNVLAYQFDGEAVNIHVPVSFSETPPRLKTLVIQGLRKLANEFKSNPAFLNIQYVAGESWIIFKHPKLVEALGFTILNINEEKRVSFANMTREKFLKLYS